MSDSPMLTYTIVIASLALLVGAVFEAQSAGYCCGEAHHREYKNRGKR